MFILLSKCSSGYEIESQNHVTPQIFTWLQSTVHVLTRTDTVTASVRLTKAD